MKLLVLAPQPFFQNRGTPIATLKMLHVLSSEGHDIDLLTYHEGDRIDVPNCHHVRIPNLPFIKRVPPGFSIRKLVCDFFMTICVVRLCWRNDYDVIHAVEESVFMAMMIKTLTGVPYIYDMDSSLPNQIVDQMRILKPFHGALRWFEGAAIRNSSGVVAVCQSLEQVAAKHSQDIPIVRIEDASLLTEAQQKEEGQSNEISTMTGRKLMYVGNLQTYQGIDLLLDAFTHVYHCLDDVQLIVIGGSAEHMQRYKALARQYKIADRTHILGPRPVEQLGEYLDQADVLVSPRTLGSNTPMKIFSYLESGIPVLATDLSMHTQVLDDSIAMLVAPTPLEMARGMVTLLNRPETRTELANAAQTRVTTHFAPELLDSKLTEFYQELAQSLGRS